MSTDQSTVARQPAECGPRSFIDIPLLGRMEVVEAIAIGGRCTTLRARCSAGRDVVLKLFAPSACAKHERRSTVPLAQYEYERNLALWGVASLRGCVAKPLSFVAEGERQIFAQELIEGTVLEQFVRTANAEERRSVSAELARIVAAAHTAEFYDLDLHPGNVLVCREQGRLRVMLFDFDRIPYHVRPPNPLARLLVWCGLISAKSRDLRHLKALDKMLSVERTPECGAGGRRWVG